MGEAELLDIGTDRRGWLSRRVMVTLLAALVVIAVVGVVVESRIRHREERAVAGCADGVTSAVDRAGSRINAMYGYVRPALDSGPRPALENGLYLMISRSARGADLQLASARRACAAISVLPLHEALLARRDLCVRVLDAQRSSLEDVARDGEALLRWMAAPRSC